MVCLGKKTTPSNLEMSRRMRRGGFLAVRRTGVTISLISVLIVAFDGTAGSEEFQAPNTSSDGSSLSIYSGTSDAAPLRVGAGIPLEVFFKVAGSEAQVLQGPFARGAGMLVDTRISKLGALLVFGVTPTPPVDVPSPTVAESVWTEGADSPQTADASLAPGTGRATPEDQRTQSGPVPIVRAGEARADAAEGPRGRGSAAYGGVTLSPEQQPNLLRLSGLSSESTADAIGDAVTSSALASVSSLALLNGMITVEGIHARARAVSTGRPGAGKAETAFELGRVTALEKQAEITPDGIRIIDAKLPVSLREAMNSTLQENLAQAGVTIRLTAPSRRVDSSGLSAKAHSQGLYVRLAGSQLRSVYPLVGDASLNLTIGHAVAEATVSRAGEDTGQTLSASPPRRANARRAMAPPPELPRYIAHTEREPAALAPAATPSLSSSPFPSAPHPAPSQATRSPVPIVARTARCGTRTAVYPAPTAAREMTTSEGSKLDGKSLTRAPFPIQLAARSHLSHRVVARLQGGSEKE